MTRVLFCAFVLLGCGELETPYRDGGGWDTNRDFDRDANAARDGSPRDANTGTEDCGTRARWVYLVDSNRELIRFEPDSLTFHEIGQLDCDLSSSPFSMAVDRHATAWVLYQNGRLFAASTANAGCTASRFEPSQAGFDLFGMGFVGVGDDRADEQLFVTGGARGSVASGSSRMATVDMISMGLTPRGGTLPGWPELTGTGDGQLWAFFPDTSPPSVGRLDQATGAPEITYPLDGVPTGAPRAWAFAFWGARYYIFLQSQGDASTNVYRFDPATMTTERVLSNTGRRIVGAGVSICAPTELI